MGGHWCIIYEVLRLYILWFQNSLKPGGTVSLVRVFIRCFYKSYLIAAGFCQLVSSMILVLSPVVIEYIILFVVDETKLINAEEEENMMNFTTTQAYEQVWIKQILRKKATWFPICLYCRWPDLSVANNFCYEYLCLIFPNDKSAHFLWRIVYCRWKS